MMPVEREFVSPDFVRLGTQIACVELIRSGVTCFADMYYYEESVAQATAEIGLAGGLLADRAEISSARRQILRRIPGRSARVHPALERPSIDCAFCCAPRALYLHRGNLARHRCAGGRIRCAAAHPYRRDCHGGGKHAATNTGMPVVPYVARSKTCSRPKCWRPTVSTSTKAR